MTTTQRPHMTIDSPQYDYARHYRDTGCEHSPTCLSCPLARCKYDRPPAENLSHIGTGKRGPAIEIIEHVVETSTGTAPAAKVPPPPVQLPDVPDDVLVHAVLERPAATRLLWARLFDRDREHDRIPEWLRDQEAHHARDDRPHMDPEGVEADHPHLRRARA
jgi:hypothetical protein